MPRPNETRAPALRISHIVYGREHRNGKVYYHLAPECRGPKGIPEAFVLWRWRRRRMEGWTFGGARLSPNFWRALDVAFPKGDGISDDPDLDAIRSAIAASQAARRPKHYTLPAAETLEVMFRALGPERIRQLVERHRVRNRDETQYGIPDLFLYMLPSRGRGTPVVRFVEVKKPYERVRPDQRDEIDFLNQLGLPARVLRLIERECPEPPRVL
jgi:hypothetical protein